MSRENILFIYPPVEYFLIGKKINMGTYVPPLGILYLAKILEDKGYNVEVIDYSAHKFDEEELKKKLDWADLVGLSVLTPSLDKSIEIAKKVRQINSDIPFIIGGPHCSLCPKQSLIDLNADVSVSGYGEYIIYDLVKTILNKKDLSKIKGITYNNGKKSITTSPPVQPDKNIDNIGFPSRHLVKNYRYGSNFIHNVKEGEFTSLMSSRGCPNNCKFCERDSISMKCYRQRSADNVLKEVEEIYDSGYKYLMFADDNFLADKKRAERIMDGIIEKNLSMCYYVLGARVDSAEPNLYRKMKKAGVKFISFGVESGNQDVLDYYNKGTNLSQIEKAVRLSNKMGFITSASLILGAPFETVEHFEKTKKFVNKLPIDSVSYFPLDYRIGTALWYEAVEEGKVSKDEYYVPGGSERDLGLYPKEFVSGYCINATKEFYLRPKFIFRLLRNAIITKNFSYLHANFSSFIKNFQNIT